MKKLLRKIRHNQILSKINLKNANRVLDTSCQDGGFLGELLKKYPETYVSGIDINKDDLKSAQRLLPSGTFTLTDNKKIPHQDQSFDVVISSMTLHHMKDPASSLREMKRVVKKDGIIYLIDITYRRSFFGSILNRVQCPEPYHFEKFYSEQEVGMMVSNLDLKIEQIDRLLVFPATSIVMPVTIFKLKIN